MRKSCVSRRRKTGTIGCIKPRTAGLYEDRKKLLAGRLSPTVRGPNMEACSVRPCAAAGAGISEVTAASLGLG